MTTEQMNEKLKALSKDTTPENQVSVCRALLSDILDRIYQQAGEAVPPKASMLELIDSPVTASFIGDRDVIKAMHYVRILGNNARNGRHIRPKEAKLAMDNMTFLIGLFSPAAAELKCATVKPTYMSEAATRKLYIDTYLQEAGWEIVEKEHLAQPGKAGIEIEVHGMPSESGIGYCDYVLYGKDGKPLAIVEAKKTSVNPEVGRHQVDLYGECMKQIWGYKPVLYYTNGYSIKIIDGIYPDRTVSGFHSPEDLARMLQQRGRQKLTNIQINDSISGRPYQKIAITKICEMLSRNRRRGLLVMATGTGKTRVAISLTDILTRADWAKRVLFLADRTALVHQAKNNFADMMKDMSICELSGNGEKDLNARLTFSTYQTMINYIDAESKAFSIGHFDLIIIDEAHRSIFNRYGTIFQYFDSFLVGLTATPKNEVDANTYQIFGCEAGEPNYDYSLEDAVKEHYLVGYQVINRTSKLMSRGIAYDELTEEERQQLDAIFGEETPTPDFTIPANAMFKVLFNKDTCRQVITDLMKWGLRVDGGETMGKSIIFAYNHTHAKMIAECFAEMYPDLPANTCQLVDYSVNYADDLVIKFEEDDEFRIAVSVDMLDTGVDVPAVLNLVFFKPVRSKIKFIQMIGRGTRLCKDVFGPGKDKTEFQIFDYCENFRYFDMHPDGRDGTEKLTLSQRLFLVRLNMLVALQAAEYQTDAWFKPYYEAIKTELHSKVVKIKSLSSRIQVRDSMQYVDKYYDINSWTVITPVIHKDIISHITPLIDSGVNGEHLAVAFDVRMYMMEHALLAEKDLSGVQKEQITVRKICKFLIDNRITVPQVLAKIADLKTVAGDSFWIAPTVQQLEAMRLSLRELMQFMKDKGPNQFSIDIVDDFTNSDYVPESTVIDIRTYREKVMDYLAEHSSSEVIQKIHNLEPINSQDLEELERILWQELGTEEDYHEATQIPNLAAFVRSLIGLSQDAVNEKFGAYLSGNVLNSMQQEFVQGVINYVRENGDIELSDIVNTEPFSDYDVQELFGVDLTVLISIVTQLHSSVVASKGSYSYAGNTGTGHHNEMVADHSNGGYHSDM